MSQKIPQYTQVGTSMQEEAGEGEDELLAQVDTLKIVTCSICRAVYVPTGEQPERYALEALEAAFLEVCRACFRCQQPACPQCWNPIHHTCASCSEEARLPFRSPVPSLEGLVFWPLNTVQIASKGKISFICQRNGRFYLSEQAPHSLETSPEALVDPAVVSDKLPELPQMQLATASVPPQESHYPVWLQEVLGRTVETPPQGPAPFPDPLALMYQQQIPAGSAPQDRPAVGNPPQTFAQPRFAPTCYPGQESQFPPAMARRATRARGTLPWPADPTETGQFQLTQQTWRSVEEQQDMTPPEETPDEEFSPFERIENVLIVLTSSLLLMVVMMMILSLSFVQVNTFLLNFLHIDIRTEMAYLLQLK